MSYRIIPLYAIECDCACVEHGKVTHCEATPSNELVWDKNAADEDAVDAGWQIVVNEYGDPSHYCPRHVHATCSDCGCWQIDSAKELERRGWQDPKRDYALCPQCVEKEDKHDS